MVHPRRMLMRALWILNGYIGRTISLDIPHKVTVLLTYYHPARMNYIDSQVRNVLKCAFVERIVITNHNPDIKIEDRLKIRDDRLICINQKVRRTNGYRWRVANTLEAEHLIVVDDDILLFPSQLMSLFQHLISEPAIPHGYSGQIHLKNDRFAYREREDIEVDYLCELYAVTKRHVKRYLEIERLVSEQNTMRPEFIERYGEYIMISQTAVQNPRIHKTSRLLRHDTFKSPGIAIHQDQQFDNAIAEIGCAVKKIKLQTPGVKQIVH